MEASTRSSMVQRTSSTASSMLSMSSQNSTQTLASSQSAEFFWSLNSLYSEGSMTDVVVVLDENNCFRAHRIVLSASSPFFRAMFTSDVGSESSSSEIRLSGNVVEPASFKVILDFMYSRQLKLSRDNVCQVLRDACYLLMADVELKCATFIARTLSPTNCFDFLQIAGVLSSSCLTDVVLKFICRQGFALFARSPEMMKADFLQLRGMLASTLAGNLTEDAVTELVFAWVRYDEQVVADGNGKNDHVNVDNTRKRLLLNLLKFIKLPLCEPEFLTAKMNDPLIKDDTLCRSFFESALRHTEEPVTSWTDESPRSGMIFSNSESSCLTSYELVNRKWMPSLPAPYNMELTSVTTFALDETSLGIVGSDSRVDSSRWDDLGLGSHVAVFDVRTRMWRTLPSLTSVRCRPAVVAVNYVDAIVVAGGVTESSDVLFCQQLESCEVLHLSKSKWKPFAPLNGQGGDGLRLVSAQDRIFAIGGVTSSESLVGFTVSNKTCFVSVGDLLNNEYEVVSEGGCWVDLAPMSNGRTHFGAAVVGDSIYAVGGHGKFGPLASVEAFDLERQTWTERRPLPTAAPMVTSTAYGGLLTCLLSYTNDPQNGTAPYEMVTFDPRDDRWHFDDLIPPPARVGIIAPSMAVLSN